MQAEVHRDALLPRRLRIRWRRSLSSDHLQRFQGLDGALVGVEGLYEAMRQVGQGIGKLSVARGFRMALGEIKTPRGAHSS